MCDVAVSAWSHCVCMVSVYLYLNGLVVSAWSGLYLHGLAVFAWIGCI